MKQLRLCATAVSVAVIASINAPGWAAPDGPASVATVDPKARIEQLVRDLGDAKFAVRKEAAEQLRAIGYPAVEALKQAASSDDPEVSMTARALLKRAVLGVTAAWPEDLVREVEGIEELDASRRPELIGRVVAVLKGEAASFVLARLEAGNVEEGRGVVSALEASGDDALAEKLAAALTAPKNEGQARAAAWAHLRRRNPLEAVRALSACKVDAGLGTIVDQAVQDLVQQLTKKDLEAVAKSAVAFADAVPSEARFLYLQAIAAGQLGREAEAEKLSAQALALHPKEEVPHYGAGEMLMRLGLDALAAREYEAILAIDPADEIYDINAQLRLGRITERQKQYGQAADHFGKALDLYKKKRAGGHSGYGMMGISEADFEKKIADLRAKGDSAGGEEKASVQVQIKKIVKGGQASELEAAVEGVRASMAVNIEPPGFRLLDLKECRLEYHKDPGEIVVLLNNTPACKPQPFAPGGGKVKFLVTSLDCLYLFELDPVAATITPAGRFEFDYEVKITPDEALREFTGQDLKIGDRTITWKELLEGVTLDYLPPVLELDLEKPGADGPPQRLKIKVPTDRPPAPEKRPSAPSSLGEINPC